MTDTKSKASKSKGKRPSKGYRKFIRRQKQAAGKPTGNVVAGRR